MVSGQAAPAAAAAAQQAAGAQSGAPSITLEQAITLAEENDPAYAASRASRASADLDHAISRAALLPSAAYDSQYLYTQPNGLKSQVYESAPAEPSPTFIANNAIHEYTSQALVNENLSLAGFAGLERSDALAKKAAADQESARRDLVMRVVAAYFGAAAADGRLAAAEESASEASDFHDLTVKLEAGREVAHADVVKAELQLQQRQRELSDAQLAQEKTRLDLGVLLFADPRTKFDIADRGSPAPPLPPQPDVEAAAAKNNPALASALEALRAAKDDVAAARAAYLPTLSLNYTYGIDAAQFAVNNRDDGRNLGYSAFATVNVPVWDWLATHDRVKQNELREQAAQVALTAAQKQTVANLEEYYSEAKVASNQLASLEGSVRDARESLRLTRLRYSAGEATALEVVDAEATLSQTEIAAADGAVRYRVALANLQTLTGAL